MPPQRRRYGTRSQSQTQTQTQPSPIIHFTPPRPRKPPTTRAPNAEPARPSQSTPDQQQPDSLASLPPLHGVSVASHRPPTRDEALHAAVLGAAALADCKHITADLHQLVPIPRRLGLLSRQDKGKGKAKAEGGFWRTATLAYACTCEHASQLRSRRHS